MGLIDRLLALLGVRRSMEGTGGAKDSACVAEPTGADDREAPEEREAVEFASATILKADDSKAYGGRPRTGFWSGETLRARLPSIILNGAFDEKRIDKSSYRLSVGREIYISPASEAADPKYRTRRILKSRESCEIPPGQFALLLTEEAVHIPNNAFAFISMRSKQTKFRGLVNVSGFHADPGYVGKLLFAVFNAGPASVHVTQGDQWFALFLADLDRDDSSETRRPDDGYHSIPSDHITPIANEFYTFQGLNAKIRETKEDLEKRLQKVERDNAIVRWATALILAFFIAFGVRYCADQSQLVSTTVQPSNSFSSDGNRNASE